MKVLSGVSAAMVTLGAFACTEEHDIQPEAPGAFVSAQKNEVAWNGTPEIHLNPETDTLTLFGIANRPNDEVLILKLKFEGVGTYALTKNQAYYYTTVGGDVLTSEYKLSPLSAGVLRVSCYDAAERLIEGSFALTLTQERSNPDNNVPTLQLTDGRFRGIITD